MIYPQLWEKLKTFEMDVPGDVLTFTERLARENGWSIQYASGAILEYKRFVYLATISGKQLTPSDEVDQVWHLHLTYTRNYWGPFTEVLGKPLHHGPTRGGVNEDRRFEDQYNNTLKFYREEFGISPNADYWPRVEDRFSKKRRFVRVDVGSNLVLQKPTRALWRSLTRFAGVASFPLVVVGYAVAQTTAPIDGQMSVKGWIMVAGMAVVIAVFGCLVWRMEYRTKHGSKHDRSGKKPKSGNHIGGAGTAVGCGADGNGSGGCGGGGCGGGGS